jgi:phosphoglycolate phosphatase
MKLAIFDVDGTLVDSRAMITASLDAAFAATGIAPPERAKFMSIVGLSLVDAMRALVPHESADDHQRLAVAYKRCFWDVRASGAHAEDLFDGAHDSADETPRPR